MNITNYFNTTSDLNIILGADNTLDIINSSIGKEKDRTNVTIIADTINLEKTKISGEEVELESSTIITDNNSKINASKKATLKTNDLEKLNINSPSVTYNDKPLITKTESITLEKVEDPIILKRLELTNMLKQLKDKIETKNELTINKCKSNLESKPISRVLTKKVN